MSLSIDKNILESSAEIDADITNISIPAFLSKHDNLENIFLLLKKNKHILNVSICDDYLDPLDEKTNYFILKIAESLPNLKILWTREFKIDGRHGR